MTATTAAALPLVRADHLVMTHKSTSFLQRDVVLWRTQEFSIIEPGLYLLLGRNGSGKSTFLRCLSGLVTPRRGQVWWQPGITRGTVPELPGLPPPMAVGPFLCTMTGFSKTELLTFLANFPPHSGSFFADLPQLFKRPCGALSKGQQQKLMLFLALSRSPQVLLLDEPFSGLDPWAKDELCIFLLALIQNSQTLFISTHETPRSLEPFVKATALCHEQRINWCPAP